MRFTLFLLFYTIFSLTGFSQNPWEEILLVNIDKNYYWSSSELNKPEDFIMGKYDAINLFDRDKATAWVEGEKGNGIGQYVMIGVGQAVPGKIFLNNGFQKSKNLFYKNNRLKSARIALYVGINLPGHETQLGPRYQALKYEIEIPVLFDDSMKIQAFDFSWEPEDIVNFRKEALDRFKKEYPDKIPATGDWFSVKYIIKITITGVYKGTKWDDTCISDIWVEASKASAGFSLLPQETITDIYLSDDERIAYVNTNQRKKIILADVTKVPLSSDEFLTLSIMDISPDKEWVQIDYMHGNRGGGDVEEIPWLFNAILLKRVDKNLIGEDISAYYGFEVKNDKIWLDTEAGLIDLDEVFGKMKR